MRVPKRSTLVPLLAFGLTFAAAIGLSLTAGASPEARLHARVASYLEALQAGDPGGAAAFRRDRDPRAEADRAAVANGSTWRLVSIDLEDESARSAKVTVLWLLARGREVVEREVWVREDDGPWSFWAIDDGPPGGRR